MFAWTCYIATLHNANCRTTDTSTRKTNLTARKRISDWKALSVSFSRSFSTPSILLLFDARKISITLPLASALARAIMPSTMTEFDWQSGRDERRTVFVPTLKTTLGWVHRVILCYCGIFVMRFTRYLMSFYVVFFCICVVFLMNICNVKSTLGWKSSMNVMNAFEVRNESVQWHFEIYPLIDIKRSQWSDLYGNTSCVSSCPYRNECVQIPYNCHYTHFNPLLLAPQKKPIRAMIEWPSPASSSTSTKLPHTSAFSPPCLSILSCIIQYQSPNSTHANITNK